MFKDPQFSVIRLQIAETQNRNRRAECANVSSRVPLMVLAGLRAFRCILLEGVAYG